ncbi:hypothetical protein L3C95_23080 [Chitinophaga filiformis]|uniref:hypothetical protein n=1 Tax=Chitinophaga filiformis TaxID=104663 RepID=UPI001F44288D|nr:hypothetical protein [Chitinophaga filiformis]MCF6405801.1 hypothetical protein [Chitinophaga filiformis]
MKPYMLLVTLLLLVLGTTQAQQRTRDKLFPSFQQDYSALRQKENKQAAQTKDARTTREQIFTDYRPQHNTRQGSANTLKAGSAATGKNPSDVGAAEAVKTIKAREVNLPAPQTPPTQGNESERNNSPLKTAPPIITAPAKGAVPTAAPAKRSFERKKQ